MRRRLVAATALATLTLAGCAGSSSPDETTAPAVEDGGVRIVRAPEAAELAARPGVTVLDVRTPEEFAVGHLSGAINLDMSAPGAAERFAALDPDGSYLVYCRSGNRSAEVREFLRAEGFSDVADLFGGILAWEEHGFEVRR